MNSHVSMFSHKIMLEDWANNIDKFCEKEYKKIIINIVLTCIIL